MSWRADRTIAMLGCAGAIAGCMLGCQTQKPVNEHSANPALAPIQTPAGGRMADADRAALARFVGVWSFEGWSKNEDGTQNRASGQAAGTIENTHFVLLDLRVTSGQLSGSSGRKSGSMLFASEPGVGVTLTAWGDANPSISRLVGEVQGQGSAFSFDEVKTVEGHHRHSIGITFQTDDKWTVEIRDASESGDPVVARYEFVRAADSSSR